MLHSSRAGRIATVAVGCAFGASSTALGSPQILTFIRDANGAWRSPLDSQDPQAVTENYWRSPVSQPPGETFRRGVIATAGDELGDDLDLVNYQPGSILSAAGWNIVNLSSNQSLTGADFMLRWYRRSDMTLLGSEFVEFRSPFPIPAASGAKLGDSDGFVAHLQIPLDDEICFTNQILQTIGIELADAGQMYGGPLNTGSSSSFVRNFTDGQMVDAGSAPLNNMLLYVRSQPIPTPATASVALIGLIACTRRRRRPACPWLGMGMRDASHAHADEAFHMTLAVRAPGCPRHTEVLRGRGRASLTVVLHVVACATTDRPCGQWCVTQQRL